jgi:hypothetical protein
VTKITRPLDHFDVPYWRSARQPYRDINPDSPAERTVWNRAVFSVAQDFTLLVCGVLPSCFIKKKKGGEYMKIKVHVRAGGPAKAR